jgi:hypothetical protein
MNKEQWESTHLPQYVYHLADAANWPSIQQHGLFSTSTLLDMAEMQGKEREQVERQQRTRAITLANGAMIRDQVPMPPTALERCLLGMTPGEWYALLNTMVFFWPDRDRLNRMLKANGGRPQIIMIVDTQQLLAAYAEQAALAPINTGNARRKAAPRGRQTFVPYKTWVDSRWDSEAEALGTKLRPRNHPPAELTISGTVPDIMHFVSQTRYMNPGELFTV